MAKEVTLKDYQSMVQRRMDNLNDEDRETLRGLLGTPQIRAIGRVLGSELMSVIQLSGRESRKRGLAAR
jgi:hypothetical protein|tara:strand:+ start:4240 stop:4446 length:207 start_codon:yes stop_codon:yes gene_type:complete